MSLVAQEFLPFSRPTLGREEIDAVAEVLHSGWITTGPRCTELEEAWCRAVGAEHAISLTSATAGMHLALLAHGVGPGDEVITPSMTWVSTVNLITLLGATPVFADVDRETLMVTRGSIEPLIGERTRWIVPVHYAGAALDLNPLRALAREHDLGLLEDAAHAAGTQHEGVPVGNRGTAIFSLHPIKNVTSGEGGIVCTDQPELADRIRRLRFHGLGADTYGREASGRSPQSEVLEPGFKYNLPDVNAAIGVVQMRRLEEFVQRREQLAHLYLELLQDVEELRPLGRPAWSQRHAWHLFIVRLDIERAGMSREEFMQALKEKGIGTGIHFRAVHQHRWYREHPEFVRGPLVNTDWNSERLLSLPLFPGMELSDVERVVRASCEILA
jgi:UDP-4-amino-4-deoxy-L-arabinose-oxoglutarate aminotransferase